MRLSEQFCDAQHWAAVHFGRVQLGDVRRRRRVCKLVAGWACQPGASIPQLGAGVAYASKAAYHLLNQPGVTPEVLQALARWPGSPAQADAPRPAVALLGLLDQQYYVRQPVPDHERAHPYGGIRPRQGRACESEL